MQNIFLGRDDRKLQSVDRRLVGRPFKYWERGWQEKELIKLPRNELRFFRIYNRHPAVATAADFLSRTSRPRLRLPICDETSSSSSGKFIFLLQHLSEKHWSGERQTVCTTAEEEHTGWTNCNETLHLNAPESKLFPFPDRLKPIRTRFSTQNK